MKIVLVTGAGGFIGSNMVKYLLDNTDYIIHGVDNFVNGTNNKEYIQSLECDRFSFYETDFTDFKLDNIDIVYHFAASPSVPYSVKEPLITHEYNVNKTLKLLQCCVDNKVGRLIFSSTSAVYGDTIKFPTDESTPVQVQSPYATQKYIIEQYSKIWSNLYGLDVVCLRYFNVYGPRQYANNAYSNVICSWMKGFIENTEIRLDGTGEQMRSFVYVDDICKANHLVGEHKSKFHGDIFNVSDDKSYSLLDIKNMLSILSKNSPKINYAPKREGDVYKTHASIHKISRFGFVPDFNIEMGLELTYEWYKQTLKSK